MEDLTKRPNQIKWRNALKPALILVCIVMSLDAFTQPFTTAQKKYPRVREAFQLYEASIRKLFLDRKMSFPPKKILLRQLKADKKLELWATNNGTYELIKTYQICRISGTIGPKRQQGDLQMPEGIYYINRFNPNSLFHLSLGLNYPNKSDLLLKEGLDAGNDIFIHGACVTVGCTPLQDEQISELYTLCVMMKNAGQKRIPVHSFPTYMHTATMKLLYDYFQHDIKRTIFWQNLQTVYTDFEQSKRLSEFVIDAKGHYQLK